MQEITIQELENLPEAKQIWALDRALRRSGFTNYEMIGDCQGILIGEDIGDIEGNELFLSEYRAALTQAVLDLPLDHLVEKGLVERSIKPETGEFVYRVAPGVEV